LFLSEKDFTTEDARCYVKLIPLKNILSIDSLVSRMWRLVALRCVVQTLSVFVRAQFATPCSCRELPGGVWRLIKSRTWHV